MPILKPKKSSESGISMLIIIVAIVGFMIAMRYVTMNMDSSNKRNKEVSEAFTAANHQRFVQQVVADDQLCKVTNFLEGIKGYSLTTPKEPIVVKDTGKFVDYSGVGIKGLKWPSDAYETVRPFKGVTGKAKVSSVAFIQPTDREVIKAEIRGKTYYRIPINVVEKGTFDGKPVYFDEKGGPILTYIELNPDNFDEPLACYKDVSPRSLCLDAGGDYDATAEANKCLMPFQHPDARKGGTSKSYDPASAPKAGDGSGKRGWDGWGGGNGGGGGGF